jgi:hypothetical protein
MVAPQQQKVEKSRRDSLGAFPSNARDNDALDCTQILLQKNPARRRSGSHEYLYVAPNQQEKRAMSFILGERCGIISSFFSLTWRGAAEGRFLLSNPFAIQISAKEFMALVLLKECHSSGYLLKI